LRAVILDMDGVLWRGSHTLDGVPEAFRAMAGRDLKVAVATNNATVEASTVVRRLAEAGVEFPLERVLTSADAAAGYLARHLPPLRRVFVIGEAPLARALRMGGCEIVANAEDSPQAVVVGMDRALDWPKLTAATLAIRAGAAFIGTNPDRTFPSERGIGPGNGAVLAALQAATGIAPTIVGKPEPHLFLEAARRLHAEADEVLVVGDRLETDIVGGQRAGMATALLLTGVTTRQQSETSEIRPTVVLDDLPALAEWLTSAE
jgi:4-nitrophenyl phosphatase